MLPGKLYIKILLSFLAVLFTTLLVVFALFTIQPGRHFTTRLEEYAWSKALKVQAVLNAKLRAAPDTDWSRNESLRNVHRGFRGNTGGQSLAGGQGRGRSAEVFPGGNPEASGHCQRTRRPGL